jgi:anti-anti-sigma factor
MTIDESRIGQISVVALTGRLDSTNADELMRRLKDLLTSAEKAVLLDLGGVLYLTSAAIRAMLMAAHEAQRNTARFVLCNMRDPVREIFAMGEFLDSFTIHDSREEALAKLA